MTTTKVTLAKCIYSAILLAAVTMLTCGSVASEATDLKTLIARFATSRHALGADLDDGRVDRRLRTTVASEGYNDEGRGISAITKIKDLTHAGTKKLEKLAETAKNRLTSNNQYTTNKRFKQLKVEQGGSHLFASTQFETWAASVGKACTKNPEAADAAMVTTLVTHYGDEALASMLVAAKQVTSTTSTATRLENVQVNSWMADGKTADNIFKLLKLDGAGGDLLKSPILSTWMAYASKFESPVWGTWVSYLEKREADPDKALFAALRTGFGDEALTQMVVRAKMVESTKDIAAKLELNVWRMNGQTSDDIFNFLKLNKMGDEIVESPALSTWVAYVRTLKSYNHRQDPFMIITQLEERFGTVKLAHMLADSKERATTVATKGFIDDLQGLQFHMWRAEDMDPKAVTEMLGKSLDRLDNPRVERDFRAYYYAIDYSAF